MIKTILFSLLAMLFLSGCVQRGFSLDNEGQGKRIKRGSSPTAIQQEQIKAATFQERKAVEEKAQKAAKIEQERRSIDEAKRVQAQKRQKASAQRAMQLEKKHRAAAAEAVRRAEEAKRLQESQIEEAKAQEAIALEQRHHAAAEQSMRKAEEAKRLQEQKRQEINTQRALEDERRHHALEAQSMKKAEEARKLREQTYKQEQYMQKQASYSSNQSGDSDSFSFIGIIASNNNVKFENDTEENNEKSYGIRYGQQTLDWRTMITYEHKDVGLKILALEVDKILLDSLLGSPKFRPYLGLTVGKIDYENSDIVDDISGFFYGVNLGFILYATDKADVDISYHYYEVNELDSIQSIQGTGLSLHYFF